MVSTFLKPFILNILASVIFLLALTNVIGFVFNMQTLAVFGHAVGFSPMPLPFRELEQGSENMNVVFTATIKKDTHSKMYKGEELLDAFFLHGRPHRAAIPFFTLSNYFVTVPESLKKSGFVYMCRKLDGDEMIARIEYAVHKYTYRVICKE